MFELFSYDGRRKLTSAIQNMTSCIFVSAGSNTMETVMTGNGQGKLCFEYTYARQTQCEAGRRDIRSNYLCYYGAFRGGFCFLLRNQLWISLNAWLQINQVAACLCVLELFLTAKKLEIMTLFLSKYHYDFWSLKTWLWLGWPTFRFYRGSPNF